jgi:adenine-specific DNA-methyltransferase
LSPSREGGGDLSSPPPAPFGLSWPGKSAARESALSPLEPRLALLSPSTLALGQPAPPPLHTLIAADALDALKLMLTPASAAPPLAVSLGLCDLEARADVVYLDPPYNTGNTFAYSDDFSERGAREGAGRHARWLNMMYPRLLLAHRLMSPRAALFVSIDDHELHHLRLLLDEIMGEQNHIATVVVSLNPKGRQLGRYFATSHEYVVVYARDLARCALQPATADEVNLRAFPRRDGVGPHRLLPLRNTNKRFNPTTRPNLHYPLYVHAPEGAEVGEVHLAPPPPRLGWQTHPLLPVFGSGAPAVWRWSAPLVAAQTQRLVGRRVQGKLGARWDVFERQYALGRRKKLRTVWTSDRVGSTDDAVRELKAHGVEGFETPKPVALLRRLLSLMPPDSLVVDLFAGSGTTAEAASRQDLADGGARRVILTQLPTPLEPAVSPPRGGEPLTIASITTQRLTAAALALGAPPPLVVSLSSG